MLWFLLIVGLIILAWIYLPKWIHRRAREDVDDVREEFDLNPLEASVLRDIRRQNPAAPRAHVLYWLACKPIRATLRLQIANEIIDNFPEYSVPYCQLKQVLAAERQRALNELDDLYRASQVAKPQAPPQQAKAAAPPRPPPAERPPLNPFERQPLQNRDFDVFDFLDHVEALAQVNAFRVFERMAERRRARHFYDNEQNVHALGKECQEKAYKLVQKYRARATHDAIEKEISLLLLNAPLATTEAISSALDRVRSDKSRYGRGSETFDISELFFAVVMYIKTEAPADTRTELQQRLYEELAEASKQCGTGHAVRFMNVLSGFETEYQMKLSISDEVYARVSILAQREIEASADMDELLADPAALADFVALKEPQFARALLAEYKDVAPETEVRAAIAAALNRYTKTTRFT